MLTTSYFTCNPKKYIVKVDIKTNKPTIKVVLTGSISKPRHKLDIPAPKRNPKLNDDLKIGLRIFLVFSSIIATCVKIFGACRVKPGRIMFEVDGVNIVDARRAMTLAAAKLPIKCKFVERNI